MIACPAMLDVPRELVCHLAWLLAAEGRMLDTRRGSRALTCFYQALLVLVVVGLGCPSWRRDRYIDHRYVGMVREPTFLILTALAGPSLHGYGVMRAVEELSEHRVRLSAGTLYAAFDRLALEGLITIDREETVNGRVRRYYTLTPAGGTALRDESAMLRRNADLAAERLARWSVLRPRPS